MPDFGGGGGGGGDQTPWRLVIRTYSDAVSEAFGQTSRRDLALRAARNEGFESDKFREIATKWPRAAQWAIDQFNKRGRMGAVEIRGPNRGQALYGGARPGTITLEAILNPGSQAPPPKGSGPTNPRRPPPPKRPAPPTASGGSPADVVPTALPPVLTGYPWPVGVGVVGPRNPVAAARRLLELLWGGRPRPVKVPRRPPRRPPRRRRDPNPARPFPSRPGPTRRPPRRRDRNLPGQPVIPVIPPMFPGGPPPGGPPPAPEKEPDKPIIGPPYLPRRWGDDDPVMPGRMPNTPPGSPGDPGRVPNAPPPLPMPPSVPRPGPGTGPSTLPGSYPAPVPGPAPAPGPAPGPRPLTFPPLFPWLFPSPGNRPAAQPWVSPGASPLTPSIPGGVPSIPPGLGTVTSLQAQPMPQTQQDRCQQQRRRRKKRKPRTVCYQGTYTEKAKGLLKRKRKKVPCR